MAARFDPPVIQDNPTGWGPNSIPEKFKDMPYQPFSKSDRIGKVYFVSKVSSFDLIKFRLLIVISMGLYFFKEFN